LINKYNYGGVIVGLGYVGHCAEKAIVIYLDEGGASDVIEKKDAKLLDIIFELHGARHILEAQDTMQSFERFVLQGSGWTALKLNYNYKSLNEFHVQAQMVLDEPTSTEHQREVAQKIIAVLCGDYVEPPPPEKSPEEKAKTAFQNKKPRLRLKLVIRDGYQCDICASDKENSLCIVKKNAASPVDEIENLALRCRSCMTKVRHKEKKAAAQ